MAQIWNTLKNVLRCINVKEINILIRYLRSLFYFVLDSIGYLTFSIIYLFSRKESFTKERVKKILIIRLDRIGDVILSTPAIRALRDTFSEAEIHILLSEYTKDLVINNPNVDKLLIYRKDSPDKDYSLAVALHPGFRQNYLTFICGAKFRVGYIGWGGGFFLTHRIKDDRIKRIRHEVESALEIVSTVGCKTENKKLEISITGEGEKFAEDFFNKNNLSFNDLVVAIHPGARQEYIRWKKEGFALVSDKLIKEADAKVILIGGKKEEQLVEEVASLMEEKPCFAVGLKLTKLISLVKQCRLFIGNSTGPMHIASALEIPVVAIFGSIHPLDSYQAWGPWGEQQVY